MNKTALVLALVACDGPRRLRQEGAAASSSPASRRSRDSAARRRPRPGPTSRPRSDEYARLKAMSTDEIDRMGLLAEVHFDFDRPTSATPTARSSPRTPRS